MPTQKKLLYLYINEFDLKILSYFALFLFSYITNLNTDETFTAIESLKKYFEKIILLSSITGFINELQHPHSQNKLLTNDFKS